MTDTRTPPHDVEAEKAVIGSILLEWQDGLDRAMEMGINVNSFFVPAHGMIFKAIVRCSMSGQPIDSVAVSGALKEDGNLEKCGGSVFLDRCIDATPTAAHLEYYAQIVLKKALCRSVIAAARNAETAVMEPDADVEMVRSRAELSFATLAEKSPGLAKRSNPEIISVQLENWQKARHIGSAGIPSGFSFWNKAFGGFMESGLYIVSGKPGCAKTTLCRNIVEHLTMTLNLPVAVASLEMTAEQYLGSMVCRISRQNAFEMNSGNKSTDLARISSAAEQVGKCPLIIQDRPQTLPEFASWCRRMVGHEKVRLLVLDYAQRLIADEKYDTEESRYADYSLTLIDLCKDLRVPMLVVARESDKGGVYGARQWEYDAFGWVKMTRQDTQSGKPITFDAVIEKNRFGPPGGCDTLELIPEGGYLIPQSEAQMERDGLNDNLPEQD